MIGKSLGSRSLGLFNRMQTVAYFTTTNFMYSLESVFFPILCKDKNNSVYLYDSYARLLRLSSLFATFVLVLLFVISKELVILVLSETWSDGIPVLKYVLLAFLFVPISYINNSFLKIFNKPQVLLYGNIIKKIIGILILCLSVPTKDLKIICYGFIFYYALDSMISMIITKYIIKINLVSQMKYLLCNYITAVVCMCIGSYIPTFNIPIFDLIIKTVFVIVFYAVIQFGLKPVEFKEIRNIYHNFQYNKS